MAMLVVWINYWDTELRWPESWDLGFVFPYRENLSMGCPLRTGFLTYNPTHAFNTTLCCHRAAGCLWTNPPVLCSFAKKGWLPWSLLQTPTRSALQRLLRAHQLPQDLPGMIVPETLTAARTVLRLSLCFVKQPQPVPGPPSAPGQHPLESSSPPCQTLPRGLLMLSVFTAWPLRN